MSGTGATGVDHSGLTVPDLGAAVAFYTKAFGAHVAFEYGPIDARELSTKSGPDPTLARVNVPDARYRLAMLKFPDGSKFELFQYERPPSSLDRPPANNDYGGHHIAIRVGDLAEMLVRLVEMGCIPMVGPTHVTALRDAHTDRPAMIVNYILDPWGNQLELVELLEVSEPG